MSASSWKAPPSIPPSSGSSIGSWPPPPPGVEAVPHALLAAALDALGFQRLAPEKATRLRTLLEAHHARVLSPDEADELQVLMTEADALDLAGLQRLAAAVQR